MADDALDPSIARISGTMALAIQVIVFHKEGF